MAMSRTLRAALAAASIALAGTAFALPASAAENGVRAGILTCQVSSGWGFVFGSTRDLKCSYSPKPEVSEHYEGTVSKFGIDIGYTQAAVIVWGVIAPTTDLQAGSLAGDYTGVTGGFALGVGVGANALLGGSSKSVVLQPVSIQGNEGLNVAAGIGGMTLKYNP